MKQAMPTMVGNRSLCRRLCDEILSENALHAYILSGPRGTGKHTLARLFAAAVACENKGDPDAPLPCLACASCRKILEDKSPDVIIVPKDGASVKIDRIRALQNDVRVLPNDLEDKFYIIEDAHTMTPQAQNALLLTLEEPPAFVHFFLLCETPEKLLETIKSRAPTLRMQLLGDEEMRAYATEHIPAAGLARISPEDFKEMLSVAAGSIGRLEELTNDKERDRILSDRALTARLTEALCRGKKQELIPLILSLPGKQDEILPLLSGVQTALRDLIAVKQQEETRLLFYTDREAASLLSFACSIKYLSHLYTCVVDTMDAISRNANIRLSLVSLLTKIK